MVTTVVCCSTACPLQYYRCAVTLCCSSHACGNAGCGLQDNIITCKHLESLGAVQLLLNLLARHVTCAGLHLQQHQRPLTTALTPLWYRHCQNLQCTLSCCNHCLPSSLSFNCGSTGPGNH